MRYQSESFKIMFASFAASMLFFSQETAFAATVTPFKTVNQSPVVGIFGLPSVESPEILLPKKAEGRFSLDISNNYIVAVNSRETFILDGESYRLNFSLRYGLMKDFEVGLEAPFIGHGGGIFDGFIEGWHDFFGMPDGGRKDSPRNQLIYRYVKDGNVRLNLNDSNFGLGDIRLTSGYQLYNDGATYPAAVALRASIKLPTGSSGQLHGSGSTDIAIWLTAGDSYGLSIGRLSLFGAVGGMFMGKGDVIEAQQRPFAGFGTVGIGWAPVDWIAFILQLDGHTSLFKDSSITALSSEALQLHSGGSLRLSGSTYLDIAVSEDVVVNTSPDITLHLSLRHSF